MKHTDGLTKLAPALVAAQAEMKAVAMDATNPHFKNKYASLDAIIAAVRPVLAKHGLAVVQGATVPMTTDAGALVGFAVETMLVHSSGEWLTNTAIMPIAKADPQGAGAALTYGRRYSLSALLSLATDEDDDGNAASKRQSSTRAAAQTVNGSQANGTHHTPHSRPMPFGKNKDKPLGEMETDDLFSAAKWCTEKGKYADLVSDINAVLLDRAETEATA